MDYNLEVKEEARQEILDNFAHYYSNGQRPELALRYMNEVERILEYIEKYPYHFQVKYKNMREAVLKVFPYVFIYEIFDKDIVVYTLFPTKDDPVKKP